MNSTASNSTWSEAEPRLPTDYPFDVAWPMYARRLAGLGLVVLVNVVLWLLAEAAVRIGLPWFIGPLALIVVIVLVVAAARRGILRLGVLGGFFPLRIAVSAYHLLSELWHPRADHDADKRPAPRPR